MKRWMKVVVRPDYIPERGKTVMTVTCRECSGVLADYEEHSGGAPLEHLISMAKTHYRDAHPKTKAAEA